MTRSLDTPNQTNSDFIIKAGSTSPAIEAQLTDGNSNPIDLNTATVHFVMKRPGADSPTVDSSATITDPDNGIVAYEWTEADTSEPDHYNAEFDVDYDAGTGSSFDPDEQFPSDEYFSIHITESL